MPAHSPLWSAVRDRALWSGALPWTLLTLAIVSAWVEAWGQQLAAERAANLMLRGSDAPAAVSGERRERRERRERPRFDWSVGERLAEYLRYIPDATRLPLVVLLGMSQQYAINGAEPGDRITAE
jgi:hypothetical protein